MTIPNFITIIRILLTPVIIIYLINDAYFLALILFILAGLSDAADGLIARLFDQKSKLGAFLDPLADKVAIDTITVSLVLVKGLPIWVAAAILGRDLLIVLGGLTLLSRDARVPSSNVWGKGASIAMSGLLLSYAMDAYWLHLPLLILTATLLCISFVSYSIGYVRLRSSVPGAD